MDKLPLMTEAFLTDPKQIKAWLDSVGIRDWSINADDLVAVACDVDIDGKLGELKRLPVRFGKVGGHFWCQHNQLVSLEGMPKDVGGFFSCGHNRLVSLDGAPGKVGGGFACSRNQLVSLEGAPKEVSGDFYCQENQLVSLEGAPNVVDRTFWCDHNLLVDFKGLEGTRIGGYLTVTDSTTYGQDNVFVSLEGLPKDLYSKVVGLDIPFVQELAKKRIASLLDAEVAELSSEVELG